MKVLITSGGTREYLDENLVLMNINSGALGSIIADAFVGDSGIENPKHEVYYLHSKSSVRPVSFISCINIEKNSVKEVYEAMEELVPKMDLVIHTMSISHFYFEKNNLVGNNLVENNEIEFFTEYIYKNALISPNILLLIKQWNPVVSLVSFKSTVGETVKGLVKKARAFGLKNGCDIVVASDKKQIEKNKEYISYFVRPDGSYEPFHNEEQIAKGLLQSAESVLI